MGHYAWLEQRLFELLGRWSADVPEPQACVMLARHGAHRAWAAERWVELLPTIAGRLANELVLPPNHLTRELLGALAPDPTSLSPTPDLFEVIYTVVLPGLAGAYAAHRDRPPSLVSEAPTRRVLGLVTGELDHDRAEGSQLLDAWRVGENAPALSDAVAEAAAKWRTAAPFAH